MVDLGRVAPGVGQRGDARLGRQGGERLAGEQVAAFADARAPHDPGVGRVEALLEVGVGDALLGQGGPDAEEAGRHPARRAAQRAAGGLDRDAHALTLPPGCA